MSNLFQHRHRMGFALLSIMVLGLGAWTAPRTVATPLGQVCASDSARFSRNMQEFVESFVTADDSVALAARSRWGIATLAPGAVSIEGNEATCELASQAYDGAWQDGDSTTGRVVVLKFAHLRATTTEPAFITTGNRPFVITDSTFTNVVELFWP